jgi:hypothetical protein
MALQWEFLGKQEMQETEKPGKGYVYAMSMWRTPVPGGWLLMTLNSRSNDPQPIVSFYPDEDHVWKGAAPPESSYLLRPAGGGASLTSEKLLTAPDNSPAPKLTS